MSAHATPLNSRKVFKGRRKGGHSSGSRPTSVCSTDSNYSSINLSQQINGSGDNPYSHGNSVHSIQSFSSPHHLPHPLYYSPYYGNVGIVRGTQMNQKQMAFHGSPYKKKMSRNGPNALNRLSKEKQQIYSTFKPPNSALEGNIEGTKFIL